MSRYSSGEGTETWYSGGLMKSDIQEFTDPHQGISPEVPLVLTHALSDAGVSTHTKDLPLLEGQDLMLGPVRRGTSEVQRAYRSVYEWQQTLPADTPAIVTRSRVAARLLGYLLIFAPTKSGMESLARQIESAQSKPQLYQELSDRIIRVLIRCFAVRSRGANPEKIDLDHPTRPSTEERDSVARLQVVETTKSISALTKTKIVKRDAGCALSTPTAQKNEARRIVSQSETIHIIPRSLNCNLSSEGKRDWTGSVYAFMDEYADIKLEDLRGKLIDGPTNLMQLVTIFHELVDDLRMSLIPLRDPKDEWLIIPDQYTLWYEDSAHGSLPRNFDHNSGDIIKLTNHTHPSDGDYVPLPNPKFWAVHSAATRAFQFSGAVRYVHYLTTIDRDAMASDGSSGFVLGLKLAKLSLTGRAYGRPG
ncbi:hypothetical protein SISNIDRAFT_491726 [Sistotremastrum niveocremeum HHB9708]|uniref:HNH nuclease domain-containing protein n=1 Tax=Sistotremastrum niveocremeum HHB9708 TaxID=1314777 RepID=A0A164MG61_9AGAM|nr:hypothetical protein SISNIDRAFT_491726 [Sistotremastrum niveocremeum HHB9708]